MDCVRTQKLKSPRDEHGFFIVWTVDGKILEKKDRDKR